jgi:teichuronic acid biosynthesis glycosyltransferase TuaC
VKILMLSHMYPSPVNPTAGIFVHEQVRALRDLGHDVRVVSPKGWAPPLLPRWKAYRRVPGTDRLDGVPILYPKKLTLPGARLGPRNAEAMLLAIRRPLTRIYERWPFAVIHAHMLVPDGWAAAQLGRGLGVPVVATAHRADVLDVPLRGEGSRRQVADAIAQLDQVVTVSASIGMATDGVGTPRRPVRVVPNGADTRVFFPRDRTEMRRRLGLPQGERIISFVGKLEPRKGVDHLIEAMGLLAKRPARTPLLVMAGIGPMQAGLEERARALGIGDRVRFVGKVPHDDVALWMAAGDVFVLPSLSEGLPTVVCEAMNVGLPVVATAVDGTPEIVRDGDTGLLVAPRDPVALADALARVIENPELAAAMSVRALEVGRAEYTWAANAAQMSAIYAELVA